MEYITSYTKYQCCAALSADALNMLIVNILCVRCRCYVVQAGIAMQHNVGILYNL